MLNEKNLIQYNDGERARGPKNCRAQQAGGQAVERGLLAVSDRPHTYRQNITDSTTGCMIAILAADRQS
jgi:hypothetical protein